MKIFIMTILLLALAGAILFFPVKTNGYCCVFQALLKFNHAAHSIDAHAMLQRYIIPFGLIWYASLAIIVFALKKYRLHIFLAGSLLAGSFAFSQPLESFIESAQQNSTQIIAAQLKADAAAYEHNILSALPDPVLMTEARGVPLDLSRSEETRELMVMLEQMIPAPGTLRHLGIKGDYAMRIERERSRAVCNLVVMQVKTHYYELCYLQQALENTRNYEKLIHSFISISAAQYKVGKKPKYVLYELQAKLARIRAQEITLNKKITAEAAALNQLVKNPLDRPIAVEIDSTLPHVTISDSLILAHNPFLRASYLIMQSAENDIEIAAAAKQPNVKLMGGYMFMNNADDALMARVGVSLPYLGKGKRARLEKSKVMHNEKVYDFHELQEKLLLQQQVLKASLHSLSEKIKLYETEILPALQNALDLAGTGYISGAVPVDRIIDQADRQLQAQLEYDFYHGFYKKQTANIENLSGLNRGVEK